MPAGLSERKPAHQLDDGMRQLFNGPFQRYISLPTTAMLLTPFSLLPFELATLLYRSVMLLALIIGTRLALRDQPTLPPTALVLSVVLVMLWQPARTSLQLGQVDGWIVLALGLTLFAVSRQRPWLAGIGIGVATLLKISPALLLLHCLLRRNRRLILCSCLSILHRCIHHLHLHHHWMLTMLAMLLCCLHRHSLPSGLSPLYLSSVLSYR